MRIELESLNNAPNSPIAYLADVDQLNLRFSRLTQLVEPTMRKMEETAVERIALKKILDALQARRPLKL